jgi:hypothetical protein
MEIIFSAMQFDYPHLPELETVIGARFRKRCFGACSGAANAQVAPVESR